MSVKELKLTQDELTSVRINYSNGYVFMTAENKQNQSLCVALDRNQAHLLKLWLEEYLK